MSYSYEVGIIPLKDIEVVDRFRQDYGDLDALRESIRLTNGIISAVAVKRNPEGSLFPFKLLAGGRRYFASLAEKAYELPARIYPVDTDEQSQLLIEKMENAQRKDFDWREVVSLDAALLKLLRENSRHYARRGRQVPRQEHGHCQREPQARRSARPHPGALC